MGGGAFRTGPQVQKGVWELKITKKIVFIEKEVLFELNRSKKWSL